MFRVGGLEVMHEFRDLRASEEGIGFRTRLIFECHIIARQDASHESVELPACFDSSCHAFGGTGHDAHGSSDRGVLGIEGMNYDNLRRCVVCSRFLHSRFLAELEWESVCQVDLTCL
jgi:hypothetical protein